MKKSRFSESQIVSILKEADAGLKVDAICRQQYPLVIKSWRSKWVNLSAYFRYREYIRRAIYTTNAVEAVHRQFRKLTKTKSGFPNENSLLKLLYAGILKAPARWDTAEQNWSLCISQLAIHFEGRLDEHLEL
jgi:transposase-like protein|tara:strand:+ start:809 stop:1207 length:399 start_codon:yes stop_codon:yes gene_type:complete